MSNPRGNPDFGVKYRFDYGRSEPLSAQVKAQVSPILKEKLKLLADKQSCTVPDIIREALELYVSSKDIRESC